MSKYPQRRGNVDGGTAHGAEFGNSFRPVAKRAEIGPDEPLYVRKVLSIVAMTGLFGFRDGAYRARGVVIGVILIAVALGLFLSGRVS